MDKIFKEKASRLGKLMNTISTFSVPIIKVILECFEIAFSETDLDRLLLVGEDEYTKEQLKALWGLDGKDFEEYFKYITGTGALWQRKGEGIYELAPIFPGWIEICASGPENEKRRRLIRKFSEFENVLKVLNIPPVRAYMNHVNSEYLSCNPGRMTTIVAGSLAKTGIDGSQNTGFSKDESTTKKIKINAPIDAENAVMQAGDLYPMLEKHNGHISVMNCFCRMMKKLDGGKCDYDMPVEGCVVVGRMSDMLVETGVSRAITYDEAVKLMADMEKKGCVHTVYHYGITSSEDELIICNCCTDCCFLYGSYRQGALSQLIMKAYYIPQMIDESQCVGCNRCGKFCPTFATYYDKNKKKLEFDTDKCIGCGQCVNQCPKPVRKMVRDERNVFVKTLKKKEAEHA
jgi:Pyruvate/2-oxoacid:ferredoxin oxidoreductase delta subunit